MENVENFAQKLPVVGDKETIDFIQNETGIDRTTIKKVLDSETNFLILLGIIRPEDETVTEYYYTK